MIRAGLLALALLSAPVSAAEIHGTVTAVHDGDTFTIDRHSKIRVFGIDAPELQQQCRADAIAEPGPSPCVPCGQMARDALSKLILGKEVTCTDRGKSYDRVVGECTVREIQIGPAMLSQGWAVVYPQFLRSRDRSAYMGAQASAKRAGESLWSTTFIPPSEWRHHHARMECER